MHYVELVAILAIIQLLVFGALTGRARGRAGLKAPATSGDVHFERMNRVHLNTLETLVAFLPALFLAAKYWPPVFIAGLGLVYLIGRMVYWRAYVSDPATRQPGFILSIVPTIGLTLCALIGVCLEIAGRG
jgi:uncharacterized MAPEG superfamily protein